LLDDLASIGLVTSCIAKKPSSPPTIPLYAKFARLTRQEERWGLYDNAASIGTQDTWERRLADKGVRLAGHRVLRRSSSQPSA
jgi:hypothetical protein